MPGSTSTNSENGTSVNTPGLEQQLRDNNVAILTNTLDGTTLGMHDLSGTMLSPATIIESIDTPETRFLVWVSVKKTFEAWQRRPRNVNVRHHVATAFNQLLFELHKSISDRVSGPHFTFVDPRHSQNTEALVLHTKRLFKMFYQNGVKPDHIIIGIAATEAGILAANALRNTGILVNLYHVTGLAHAAVCAEVGAASLTIPVGTLLDVSYRKRNAAHNKSLSIENEIGNIQSTLAYFRINNIRTKIIGTEFRELTEIGLLSDFDAVCASRHQVDRLKWSKVPITPCDYNNPSPAVLRAQQAKYPFEKLSDKQGIVKLLSAQTQRKIDATLPAILSKMTEDMRNIEYIIADEVEYQFSLGTMDLNTLYELMPPVQVIDETIARNARKQKQIDRWTEEMRSKSISKGAGLQLNASGYIDEDEMF